MDTPHTSITSEPPTPTNSNSNAPGLKGYQFCQANGWQLWIRKNNAWQNESDRVVRGYRHLFYYNSLARVVRHPEGGHCIRFYDTPTKPYETTLRFKTRKEADHALVILQLARANNS